MSTASGRSVIVLPSYRLVLTDRSPPDDFYGESSRLLQAVHSVDIVMAGSTSNGQVGCLAQKERHTRDATTVPAICTDNGDHLKVGRDHSLLLPNTKFCLKKRRPHTRRVLLIYSIGLRMRTLSVATGAVDRSRTVGHSGPPRVIRWSFGSISILFQVSQWSR